MNFEDMFQSLFGYSPLTPLKPLVKTKAQANSPSQAHFAFQQFNFNPMILRWWKTQGIKRCDSMECLEMTAAVGANFVVTNCSAINHFFDCHPAWCACWPCTYCLQFPIKSGVTRFKVSATLLSGWKVTPFPHISGLSNYNLVRNQPISSAQEIPVTSNAVPVAYGIPSHTFSPPPSLQGTLGNPRFKAT